VSLHGLKQRLQRKNTLKKREIDRKRSKKRRPKDSTQKIAGFFRSLFSPGGCYPNPVSPYPVAAQACPIKDIFHEASSNI
jgi:hypothetical protein